MTLIGNMADYQNPPIIPNSKKNLEAARLKKRFDKYQIRQKQSMVDSIDHTQTKYEQSEEEARKYFEKWQQQKAKKSSKRQRDSNNVQSNQLKRKLSTAKSEGPPNKQQSTEKPPVEETNGTEELKDLLEGFEGFSPDENLNEIMNILEESEQSNASLSDAYDKDPRNNGGGSGGAYPTNTSNQPTQVTNNNNATATSTPQQLISHKQQQPRLADSTSPLQQQQQQSNNMSTQSQCALNGQYNSGSAPLQQHPTPGYHVKTEMTPSATQYNRSMSESKAAISMHQQQVQAQNPMMPRQASLSADYGGAYPVGHSFPNGAKHLVQMSHGMGAHPEYARQMSTPTLPSGAMTHGSPGVYYQQPMVAAGRSRGEYSSGATLPAGYPQYPQAGPYPHPHHPNAQPTSEDHLRMEQTYRAQKAPHLARTNSHPYSSSMERRVPPTSGYYPATNHPNAVGQPVSYRGNQLQYTHSGHMVPSSAPPYSIQARPTYPPMHPHHAQAIPITGSASAAMLQRHVSPHPAMVAQHEMPVRNPATAKHHVAVGSLTRQHSVGGIPVSHTPYHTATPTDLPSHVPMTRQASIPTNQPMPALQMSSRPPSNSSTGQPSSLPMHSVHRPPSNGHQQHMHQVASPQSQHLHSQPQQHNLYALQQQQIHQSRALQAQQMHAQTVQHSNTHPQQQQCAPSQHQPQIPTQQTTPDSQNSAIPDQSTQNQIDSFMASSADDLNDLELILSGN